MDICTFIDHYINPLLGNLNKEQSKKIFLMKHFNIDLLSFDASQYINKFIGNITSSSLQPQIIQPTKRHKNHKILFIIFFVTFSILKLKI